MTQTIAVAGKVFEICHDTTFEQELYIAGHIRLCHLDRLNLAPDESVRVAFIRFTDYLERNRCGHRLLAGILAPLGEPWSLVGAAATTEHLRSSLDELDDDVVGRLFILLTGTLVSRGVQIYPANSDPFKER